MITNQAYTFIIFVIVGIVIGIIFDFFRILRKSIKTNDVFTYIEDILFCITTGIILLYSIFKFNSGEIRIYMFLGIILGCLIYMITISQYFIKINVFIVKKIIVFLKKLFSILIIPIKIVKKIILKICNPISFVIINIRKNMLKLFKKGDIKNNKTKNNTENKKKLQKS